MALSSSHNAPFTARDIERYHSGQMNPAEMHALEKAALEDPFLADALEGYRLTPTAAADSDELKSRLARRLSGERKRGTVIPINLFKAAALFLLVAGSGYLAYRLTQTGSRDLALDTSARESRSETADSVAAVPLAADSAGLAAPETRAGNAGESTYGFHTQADTAPQPEASVQQNNTRSRPVTTDAEEAQVAPPVAAAGEARQEPAATVTAPLTAPPAADNTLVQNRMARTAETNGALNHQFNFRGRVVDSNNNAVPYADIRVMNQLPVQNHATRFRSDANGYFNFAVPDSVAQVAISSLGYRTRNLSLLPQEQPKVVLDEAGNPGEAVVMGKAAGVQVKERGAPRITVEAAEPELGWGTFDEYVALNLKSNEELEVQERGVVRLSFDINEQGEPVNIKVTKSLCAKCDQEAVRILKEGPKWKKKNGKKGKANIRF
ncbi:MAG TPA: carboxypeptidase regulatory-like domain-containing protein [Chitinophagaceae bacterium]|jgi:outer membrane biosynthesis protein TonB|nr:carboxypeptidase regulatory-like domain-containing protein [Chitinophagaceae bacterium]